MVFVLDSSGSIGTANFLKVKQFVKDVINAFDIGFDKTRVGVIQYSDSVQLIFDLNKYSNKADMLAAVDRIVYIGSGTATHLALDDMTNVRFTEARGARPINEVVDTKSANNIYFFYGCTFFKNDWFRLGWLTMTAII